MRITLVRHGRPDLSDDLRRAISGREIGRWYRGYDDATILGHVEPPADLRATAAAAGCVVTSDARRARASAARIAAPERIRVEPLLREVGFPDEIPVGVRLAPGAWVLLARGLQQLQRRSPDAEAIRATRDRASRAVDALTRLAGEHETLVVVAHGWFNRFLARELRRRGWRGPRWPPTGYWSAATYRCASIPPSRVG
jgi:broad specificity phosphatase PhoE